ncbi:hypothetical protein ACIA7R_31450 [Micromonospora chalcea]
MSTDIRTELDLDAIGNDLDEVRANVAHAEAQHNPHALTALRAADALVAEVRRLRAALTQIADMCECRRGDMCGSAVAHHALHGPDTE